MKKTSKKSKVLQRDLNIILSIKGELDLRTKSESNKKPKYTRKQKHKKIYE